MRRMHPDLPENRGQDMAQKSLDLNAAYDILTGEARPAAYDYRSPPVNEQQREPSYDTTQQRPQWKAPEPVIRSFEDARVAGGVPTSGIDWAFVTATQRGKGWMSDESSLSRRAWVAYGRYKDQHFFAVAANFSHQEYFIGAASYVDTWQIQFRMFPIRADEGNDPAWLTKQINTTFNELEGDHAIGGRFNGKVIDATGWKFGEKKPTGRELSLKNWLVNHAGVTPDAPAVSYGRQTVELEFKEDRMYGINDTPKRGFYPEPRSGPNDYQYSADGRYTGSYWNFTLILNGKEYELGERDTKKLLAAKLGGKRLVHAIFGEYTYGSGKKILTRLAKGKVILKWMVESLTELPPNARDVLSAAEAQLKTRA